MSISLVQNARGFNTGGTVVSATWPGNTTLHNLLVADLSVSGGSGVTISSLPSGWTYIGEVDRGTDVKVVKYYIENASVHSGAESVTVSTSSILDLVISEYSGAAISGALDTFVTNTGSSSNPDSGNITTAVNDELLVCLLAGISSSIFGLQSSPTNGFTIEKSGQDGLINHLDIAVLDNLLPTAGVTSAGTTAGVSYPWAAIIAAFKPAAAAVRRRGALSSFM